MTAPSEDLNPYAPPGAPSPARTKVPWTEDERVGRVIGVLLILAGAWGFVVLLPLLARLLGQWPVARAADRLLLFFGNLSIMLFFALLHGLAIAGGLSLIRCRTLGRWLGGLTLAAQLLLLGVPGFQYQVWMLGLVAVGIINGGPDIAAHLGSTMIMRFENETPVVFAVNVPAALGLFLVIATWPDPRRQRRESVEQPDQSLVG